MAETDTVGPTGKDGKDGGGCCLHTDASASVTDVSPLGESCHLRQPSHAQVS